MSALGIPAERPAFARCRAGGLLECDRAKLRLSQVDRVEINLADLQPTLLASLATLQDAGQLRGTVVRLHHLLPYGNIGGSAALLPNLR